MATTHWKGAPIPEAGDDLLTAWPNALDALGTIMSASSVPAARLALTRAETEGHPATSAHPAYIDIDGVMYRSIGARGGDETIDLVPINQIESARDYYGHSWKNTLNSGVYSGMIISSLRMRPYNRKIIAFGAAWMSNISGHMDLEINAQGIVGKARFSVGTDSTQNIIVVANVPAGTAPKIQMGVRGGQPSGTGELAPHAEWTYLDVVAFPISMG